MENKLKLIITDNAEDFSQENMKILQDFNISVFFCKNDGNELCEKIAKEEPDVV